MSLLHLFRKTRLRLSAEGLKETLKEFVYFNRIMVSIEKDLQPEPSLMISTMQKIIVNRSNYKEYMERFDIKNVVHYCQHGCQALLIFEGSQLLGYQLWTSESDFIDLAKLKINLKEDEAYGIELFVFPQFRGTRITKIITVETFNYLLSQGIRKIYGFYSRQLGQGGQNRGVGNEAPRAVGKLFRRRPWK